MPALLLAVTFVTFAITNPFVFVHPDLFLGSMLRESGMASGSLDLPYTRQFAGTWPFAYQAEQLARWALGAPLAVLALAGLGYAAYRLARRKTSPDERVLLAWALPYALLTGAMYAKFTRYLLPLTPALCVYAAWLLARLARRSRALAAALGAAALVVAGVCSLALVTMEYEAHPWTAASAWIYAHVPAGATLGLELWDQPLPVPLVVDGQGHDSSGYRFVTLDPLAPDTPEKIDALAAGIVQSDYLMIASQRLYGVIPRRAGQGDARYVASACYYRRLFAGELGFGLAHSETRFPHLGPLVLVDRAFVPAGLPQPAGLAATPGIALDLGRVDESYNVYDHPQVLIFANQDHWSAERVREAITAPGCNTR